MFSSPERVTKKHCTKKDSKAVVGSLQALDIACPCTTTTGPKIADERCGPMRWWGRLF